MDDQHWGRLAEVREPTDPAGALGVYLRLVESTLGRADKRNYRVAVKQLRAARRAAGATGLPKCSTSISLRSGRNTGGGRP